MPIFSLGTSAKLAYPTDQPLDDPDYNLFIKYATDFRGMRSHAVEKEPWTFDWLRDFDENTLLYDIGACVGSYTLMAAARGAAVVAFEPLPVNAHALERNINLNKLAERITPVEAAVSSDSNGIMTVHDVEPVAGYGLGSLNEFKSKKYGTKQVEVATITLDDAAELYGYPTHIKIDVEGAELLVLASGKRVLFGVQSVIVEITNDPMETAIDRMMDIADLTGREVGNRRTAEQRTKVYSR